MNDVLQHAAIIGMGSSPESGKNIWPDIGVGCATEIPAEPPKRVQILHEGARLTNGDRDREYGPPAINMSAAGELKAVMRKHIARDISSAEMEALDMVITKLSRVITGVPKEDTYVDGSTYFAIAGEIALCPE